MQRKWAMKPDLSITASPRTSRRESPSTGDCSIPFLQLGTTFPKVHNSLSTTAANIGGIKANSFLCKELTIKGSCFPSQLLLHEDKSVFLNFEKAMFFAQLDHPRIFGKNFG